ncbi:DUF6886 family protein [Pseudonocardia sp. HH130630-07]|uniref:DUF6886 family protein n=1 Tax=Pseudonocardia sp. HH130630-07 TaxID=1690815 RepID=UPI000815036B|nr:DUF6886 family protein [Pseudonocardia sp. HH130630-07]ANY06339.1 hypothetical protein AFB00_08590 [Pseudonocardia sp. HH130630-07]
MRPDPGQVLHFSEDPTITEFVPHVAHTAARPDAFVWAVDAGLAPAYWFPRQCPRAMAWRTPSTSDDDARTVLGTGALPRVHAVEYAWLDRIRTVELFAYRLPDRTFRPIGEPEPHAVVSTTAVRPIGRPEPVGDLFARHADAGIELRVLPRLDAFWAAVTASTLGFSGIRLRNARP